MSEFTQLNLHAMRVEVFRASLGYKFIVLPRRSVRVVPAPLSRARPIVGWARDRVELVKAMDAVVRQWL